MPIASGAGILASSGDKDIATRRIAKARIPPEAYQNLRKYVAARGEGISRGRAQAKALQEARNAPRPDAAKGATDGAAKPDLPE